MSKFTAANILTQLNNLLEKKIVLLYFTKNTCFTFYTCICIEYTYIQYTVHLTSFKRNIVLYKIKNSVLDLNDDIEVSE